MKNIEKPLLSVIVASRNYEEYIGECLDSIINQTYKNVEIVIFDDASTDNTPAIIRRYEAEYPGLVKVQFNPESCGPAHARHQAILHSSGEYLTTLDSDDYFIDPQKLEKEMELVQEQKQKTGKDVISFSNIVWVNKSKVRLGVWGNSDTIKEGRIFNEIISRSHLIPRDYLMKRDLYFCAGRYDPRFPPYEDWDLKIRLAARYEFYYTGLEGIAYRQHGLGLSSIAIPDHIRKMQAVFEENIRLEPDQTIRETLACNFEHFLKNLEKRQQ